MTDWVFLTNHAQALLCVASDPEIRLRELADAVGVTERAAHRIVSDLVESGYLSKRRVGRRNHYEVNADAPLRRISHRDHTVGELLELLAPSPGEASAATSRSSVSAAWPSSSAAPPPSSRSARASKISGTSRSAKAPRVPSERRPRTR